MNPRRHRVPIVVLRICAAALLCVAAGVPAQTIYRQVDAAGHITYSDRPGDAAGAVTPHERTGRTPSPRTETASALDVASALATNTAISSRHAAVVDASEAARRLRQAQLERRQGAERLSGEQGHSTGAVVVNHRFQRRQEELRRVVEQAQRRSIETSRALRAHRREQS